MSQFASPVQTVTEITRSIKALLENGFAFVAVSGEVSNLRKPYSGHLYFTLKDQEAQLKSVLFKPQQRYLDREPANGDQLICRGRVSVYEPRGDYQLIVDSVDFAGAGALQMAFEQLKSKLAQEGLFDQSKKQPLPFLPDRIALITSPRGAAVYDFLKIAASRFPSVPIEIYPTAVQGDAAVGQVIAALEQVAARRSCDLVVICRGGGSIEDLWPFNSEKLARAVYSFPLPVVSAIGHEIDFTIVDFAADYRAPTPSAAAEAVLPERDKLRRRVDRLKSSMAGSLARIINDYRRLIDLQTRLLGTPLSIINNHRIRVDHAQTAMVNGINNLITEKGRRLLLLQNLVERYNPEQTLSRHRQTLNNVTKRLRDAIGLKLERKRAELGSRTSLLKAVSPLAVLQRGYSIVSTIPGQQVVSSSSQTRTGELLNVRLYKGSLECEVRSVTGDEN